MKGKGNMRTSFLNGYIDPGMRESPNVVIESKDEQDQKAWKVMSSRSGITTESMESERINWEEDDCPDYYSVANGRNWAMQIANSLPALHAALRGEAFNVSPPSALHQTTQVIQIGRRRFKQWFLFISPAYTAPDFLSKLEVDWPLFEEATLQSRIATSRNVTLVWLLVISLVSALDYDLDLIKSDVERHRSAFKGRVVGNYIVGILYLLLLPVLRARLSARFIAFVTIAMLSAQGAALLMSSMMIYNNEPSIIALFGVLVLSYEVCSIFMRMVICMAIVIGFLFVELVRCDMTSVKSESATIVFLGTFFCFIGCSIRLNEFMAHVAHHEKRRLAGRFEDIKVLKASGNELLNSLLPSHVISLVRQGVSPIAEHHDDVTIIFTDIKGFTSWSSQLYPSELMAFLNSMYSAFDEVIMNWGLYKVEIIGDAYFISSGCPSEECAWKEEEAAMRAVEVALALLRTMPQVCNDSQVQMRVGLHTGSVVAGVVGKKGPRFHLFGPAVVYAQKMESHGEAGRVHISDSTYWALTKGSHEYETEKRSIPVEGYDGLQKTWFVNKSNCKAAAKLQRGLIAHRHDTEIAHRSSAKLLKDRQGSKN